MPFLEMIGSLIISTMKEALLSSQNLGQSIVEMLGMRGSLTQQSKSYLEMEEWLQSSTGTISVNSGADEIVPLVECDLTTCMASDDGYEFCNEPARKTFEMPLGLPSLPVCPHHAFEMEGMTYEEIFGILIDMVTDEEGMTILKEITDDDSEF